VRQHAREHPAVFVCELARPPRDILSKRAFGRAQVHEARAHARFHHGRWRRQPARVHALGEAELQPQLQLPRGGGFVVQGGDHVAEDRLAGTAQGDGKDADWGR
jgi:hypothetical protein